MDEKQFNELMEKFKSANAETLKSLETEIKNLKEGSITMDNFTAEVEKFAKSEEITGLNEKMEQIATQMKSMIEAGPKKVKSLREFLLEDEIKSKLDNLGKGMKDVKLEFDFKTDVERSSVTDHTLAYRLPEVGQQAYQSTVIASLFRQRGVPGNNNGSIRYVDQESITRNADTVAEKAQFPESAIVWKERLLPIEKIGDTIPVSYEMLNDVDFVEGELKRLMEVNVAIKEDTQVYGGDGVTPNLVGVNTSATAFTDTTPKIQNASIYDLINVVGTKISSGKESKYMATNVLMNPADVLKMISTKDANDNYVKPTFVSDDGMTVSGMRIIPSSSVTANTMLVGDFKWGDYFTSDEFKLEIGWVANQFIEDMFTIKARKRSALLIRNVDTTAFYSVANITTALSNITA